MSVDDQRAIDQLDEALDRTVGDTRDAAGDLSSPANLVRTHRRLEALDQTPGPEPDFVKHLMEDLMHTATQSLNGSGRLASTKPIAQREAPRPILRIGRGLRGGFAHFALAALLLATLGLGYIAFDPFGRSDQPVTNPAAVVPAGTPAVRASPTTTPFPLDGHAVIGVWALYDDPSVPNRIKSWITFDSFGRFTRVEPLDRAQIGTWRPIDAHTVEVKFVMQIIHAPQLFDPAYVPAPLAITNQYEIWTLQITVDESGSTMSLSGGWDTYQGVDKLYSDTFSSGSRAVRMVLDPAAVTPTPEP